MYSGWRERNDSTCASPSLLLPTVARYGSAAGLGAGAAALLLVVPPAASSGLSGAATSGSGAWAGSTELNAWKTGQNLAWKSSPYCLRTCTNEAREARAAHEGPKRVSACGVWQTRACKRGNAARREEGEGRTARTSLKVYCVTDAALNGQSKSSGCVTCRSSYTICRRNPCGEKGARTPRVSRDGVPLPVAKGRRSLGLWQATLAPWPLLLIPPHTRSRKQSSLRPGAPTLRVSLSLVPGGRAHTRRARPHGDHPHRQPPAARQRRTRARTHLEELDGLARPPGQPLVALQEVKDLGERHVDVEPAAGRGADGESRAGA